MLVNFNPSISNNKNSNPNPNFTALDIAKITKNEFEAENFVYDVIAKGKIDKTSENISDLTKAIQKATDEGKKVITFHLKRIAKEWEIIK